MVYLKTKKIIILITILLISSLTTPSITNANDTIYKTNNMDDPVHQIVYGYITYSDGSWVPIGVPVTITNLDEDDSAVVYTVISESGQTNLYVFDVYDVEAQYGDTILINVSYGGCAGNDTIIVDNGPTQRCDITIYGNLPPAIPSQPSGPTEGYKDVSYTYSTNTTDPDGDDVYYWFDWGEGTNSGWVGPYTSGVTGSASNSWSSYGTYKVKAKAKDTHGAELGTLWSDKLTITIVSQPPNTPSTPSGPTLLNIDESGTYSTNATDPDGDQVQYRFDWDVDGSHDYSDWSSLVPSGTTVSMDNSWSSGGTYVVKAQARDEYNLTSEWSSGLSVSVNNPPNTPGDPEPEDGATEVDIEADLSWNCSDPDGDSLTYNVYFEANDPTPDELVSENQTGTTYDPGAMNYNTHYYWQIEAWDNNGASTLGPVWDFTTMSEPNNPPYTPSDPDPEDGATNVNVDADLSWTGGDPDPGDTVVYDVYLEANDSTPDMKVADDISKEYFDPGTLQYETMYYWQIFARDNHGAITEGPVWCFTTEGAPVPDLDCEGSLTWTNVEPGGTVTDSFIVKNIGEPGSELDWEVITWPSWGTWTFNPQNGTDLPKNGETTVQVTVVAPDEQNEEFTGEVKVVNKEDSDDYCIIPVSLTTPVNFFANYFQLVPFQYVVLISSFNLESTQTNSQLLVMGGSNSLPSNFQ